METFILHIKQEVDLILENYTWQQVEANQFFSDLLIAERDTLCILQEVLDFILTIYDRLSVSQNVPANIPEKFIQLLIELDEQMYINFNKK